MTTLTKDEVVTADRLRSFAIAVLRRVGMPDDDATTAADAMVWADLRDLPMHGVYGKLPQCVRRINAGVTSPTVAREPLRDTPSFAVFDATNGWGQVAAARGMRAAIAKARANGVGLVVMRNSSSAAAMGHYASLAIAERMIGMAITNGPPLMAPPGGTTRVVGNQGFAIGAPAGRHDPLLYDSALSLISTGEIHTAHEKHEALAPGLMLDAQGRPTTDPVAALEGLYLAIGGHRGFGIALMWEVLTGVLSSGARVAPDVGSPDVLDKPQGVSHFLLAIDPSVAMPYEEFTARVDALIDQVHASPPAEGVSRIYVAGERGFGIARQRAKEGVPLPAARLEKLRALGEQVGVAW